MRFVEWIRGSFLKSSVVIMLVYLAALAGAMLAVRGGGSASDRALVAAGLMAAAVLVTGMLARGGPYPRWAMVMAACILAAAPFLPILVLPDPTAVIRHPAGTLGYGPFYLWLAGSTRAGGLKWCASPWSLVVGSALLGAGMWLVPGVL